MTKDDWITVWLEKSLIREIDKFILSPKSRHFGSKRYTSRPDFVRDACIKLLEEETKKGQLVEVSAKQ